MKKPPRTKQGGLRTDAGLLLGLFNRNGHGDGRADHGVVAHAEAYHILTLVWLMLISICGVYRNRTIFLKVLYFWVLAKENLGF